MKVVVVGGGASGMVTAIFQKRLGNDVILIEKNEKLGKKLYITGKGRCNLCNDCDEGEFLQNVVNNSKFLTSAIYSFNPQKTMEFFEELGLSLKTERGNRVFPVSDKSSDVIKVLQNELISSKVEVHLNETVIKTSVSSDGIFSIITDKTEYFADKLIIATGGITYTSTGSTGDGYLFAKRFGHTVTDTYPSLCGINLLGEDYKLLQGVTLKNVELKVEDDNKVIFTERGELLFTHYGVSGPLVLTASALLCRRKGNKIKLSIDLKPALDKETLDKRILRDFLEFKNKEIKNSLDKLLPKALINLIIDRSKIPPYKKVSQITSNERLRLIETIKNLSFDFSSLRGANEAVITSGGVCVKEINPKTMESKLVKNLYFVGEVLDVDAFTGGFNLQIAFSTAHSAGIDN